MFPAYAGVFPFLNGERWKDECVPRIRGGVPQLVAHRRSCASCSPHTRGCSHYDTRRNDGQGVFPAYAGVFLQPGRLSQAQTGVPRIRGGVPPYTSSFSSFTPCSPHTRGCSHGTCHTKPLDFVFPAYAGVFRQHPE